MEFNDRLGLSLAEVEAREHTAVEVQGRRPFSDHRLELGILGEQRGPHEGFPRFFRVAGGAHGLDHRIEVLQRLLESKQDMLAVARLAEQEFGPAADDFHAVLDEAFDDIDQPQLARLPVDDGEQDHAEADLHLRQFVQVIEDDVELLAPLEFNYDSHSVAVALVADVADPFDALFVNEGCDLLDQLRFVHLVRQLVDDDGIAVLAELLRAHLGADLQAAASTGEIVENALPAEEDAAGGEIRPRHHLHDLVERERGVLDQRDGGFDDLFQVVRRNAGRHADGDALAAVDQQIGDARGQNLGFVFAVVVVGAEFDRVLVDILQQHGGDLGQTGLGVPHGRRRIVVHRAEIALAFDQRVAHGKRLGHANQGIVDGRVAVGVVLTEDFTDNLCALARGAVVRQPHLAHSKQDAAMNRFQTVTHVRQRASDNHGHRVVEIRAAHLLFDVDRCDISAIGERQLSASALGRLRPLRVLRILGIRHFGILLILTNPALPERMIDCGFSFGISNFELSWS